METVAAPDNLDFELSLLERAVLDETNEISRYLTTVGAGWILSELSDREAAVQCLDLLRSPQPRKSDTPYVEHVKAAINAAKDRVDLEKYQKSYFAQL